MGVSSADLATSLASSTFLGEASGAGGAMVGGSEPAGADPAGSAGAGSAGAVARVVVGAAGAGSACSDAVPSSSRIAVTALGEKSAMASLPCNFGDQPITIAYSRSSPQDTGDRGVAMAWDGA